MPHHVIIHSILHAFRHPFDVATPMSRLAFWIFYPLYTLICLPVIALTGTLAGLAETWLSGFAALIASGIGTILVLYLMAVLFSAIARRMRDSGYHRGALPLAGLAWAAWFASFARDIWLVLQQAQGSAPSPSATALMEQLRYSPITITLFVAALLVTGFVFLGTVRPAHKAPAAT